MKKKISAKKTTRRKTAVKPARTPARRQAATPTRRGKIAKKRAPIGIITHYFPKSAAAAVKLLAPLAVGDTIKIKGHTTDFSQEIVSMQLDRTPITAAVKGQEIGIAVSSRVRRKDKITRI